ncbi:Methylmalonyl-CoA epimerase [Candidatus Bealeia paramacronuclearis]|uniref:Methylmalonyl-CoA epimerase n=1 Tax=Candidatus Bealeia paramacronuclearis TaxID=1921001 RepID=A0ABZ2C4Z3_9PROT|nr:Methylmalonyl-CoA epimerase [Candidatus Bealeia paramacronuclearis]
MLGKLNHVAIVVPDLEAARAQYKAAFGADVSDPKDLPDQGVTAVMVTLPNTRIELLYPYGENSPIAKFLARNSLGGVHHLCFEVPDILAARDQLAQSGITVIGDGTPTPGYDGHPILFFNPKNTQGTLIELKQSGISQDVKVTIEDPAYKTQQNLEPPGGVTISFEGDFLGTTSERQE